MADFDRVTDALCGVMIARAKQMKEAEPNGGYNTGMRASFHHGVVIDANGNVKLAVSPPAPFPVPFSAEVNLSRTTQRQTNEDLEFWAQMWGGNSPALNAPTQPIPPTQPVPTPTTTTPDSGPADSSGGH